MTRARLGWVWLCVVAIACDHHRAAAPPTKVLTYPRVEAYKGLDPARQFDGASSVLVHNLYDRLVEYEYLARPFELAPNLITALPTASADGLRYRFELRGDARFQDDPCFAGGKGRAVTSDDVLYSIKRFADAKTNSLSYMLLEGSIAGLDEFRAQTAKTAAAQADIGAAQVRGLIREDDRHFTIELTRPSARALLPFAADPLSIVPREAVQYYGEDFDHHPVGSGPFRLEAGDRRGVVVLKKNPRYHRRFPEHGEPSDREAGLLRSAGRALPLVDEVRLPLIEETQPRMLRFLQGELDVVPFDRESFRSMTVSDARGSHLKPEFAAKYRMYAAPDLSVEGLRFNFRDPLLGSNKALRQAITYALDTAGFVAQMYPGRGVPLRSLIPLPIAGSERDVRGARTAIGYSPELVQQKLREAGYPNAKGLPKLTIEYRGATSLSRTHFEFQRAQLARSGIVLEANFQNFSAYLQKVESGQFQLCDFSWTADYPDAESLYQILYSKNRAPGPNHGSYANPAYDALFEQSRRLENGPARYALFARMNAIIEDDVPVAGLWNLIRTGLTQPWVRDFKDHPLLEAPLPYLDVDRGARSRGVGPR